uniref:Uncharacterized protein n=1 Tax=Aegilops tauschii TaxID=37682 RepID=N1QTP4_AEGTA
MESPPPKRNAGHVGEDGISALPDHLLLDILERLHLREAVRAGALSTRWRHLPSHLSRVHLDVAHFRGATPLEVMDAFTGAARALLARVPLAEGVCGNSALKVLVLSFYTSPPHRSSIGRLVEDIVSLGNTQCLEFCISPPPTDPLGSEIENVQEFMAFSRAYPVAFSWLTRLTLEYHAFGHSDITDLISTCGRLRHLSLRFCGLLDLQSTLKIDVPCSELQELYFIGFLCTRIELVSVPKLRQVECKCWHLENPPVRFGHVPELRVVILYSKANACECDLSWTLFILEAAPALYDMTLSRHSCTKTPKDSAEKTNVVWEPSKDLKHLNLKVLRIFGCEEEGKVTNYIRLVMERAVGLLKIKLYGESPCRSTHTWIILIRGDNYLLTDMVRECSGLIMLAGLQQLEQ